VLRFELSAPYPNPFNGSARIPFELGHTTRVVANLYDLNGRIVERIANEYFLPGHHDLIFSADPALASGVYLVDWQAAGQRQFQKLVLLK
jgi:hypothetical protein